jgi:MFS family permease
LVNVTVMAVRQAATPDGMQGRAAATITFVGMGMAPLGSLLGGFLAMEWGLRTSLLVTAAGMMLSPVVMALSPLARLGRALPAMQDAPSAAARSEAQETALRETSNCPPGDVETRSH